MRRRPRAVAQIWLTAKDQTTTMAVRIRGALSEFVAANVGEGIVSILHERMHQMDPFRDDLPK